MRTLDAIVKLLVVAMFAMLASCIDSREEFWIRQDGSGKAQISLEIPSAAARIQGGEEGISKLISNFFSENPSIQNGRQKVTTVHGRTMILIDFSFDSALDLQSIRPGASSTTLPPPAEHFIGEAKTRWQGSSLEITRQFSPGKALPGAGFMPASSLKGSIVSIMHLPVPALTSNATRTENKGHTLVWETPFAQAVQSPVVYRFKMNIPIPWNQVGWIAAAIAMLGGMLWWWRIRKAV